MDRWNPEKQQYTNRPDIDAFIYEVLEICKRHNFSITSGDCINSLEISDYDIKHSDALQAAMDCTTEKTVMDDKK